MNDKAISVIEVENKPQPEFPLIPVMNPLDLPIEVFSSALNRRLENRKLVMKAIKSNLKNGVDYGSIPLKRGTASKTKPVLFKSGCEKILSLLGLTAHYPGFESYQQAAITSDGFNIETIILRCELLDALGRRVAEGIGARKIAQDFGDVNKSMKMCSKSAAISAVLSLGFSEMFTVDLIEEGTDLSGNEAPRTESKIKPITQDQLEQLTTQIEKLGLDQTRFNAYCDRLCSAKGLGRVNTLSDLPADLYEFVLNKLPTMAEQSKVQAMAA